MSSYELIIKSEVASSTSGGSGGSATTKHKKTEEEKAAESAKKAMNKFKAVAAGTFSAGVTIASKLAGSAGNYIEQTRIRETVAAVGVATGVVASVALLAKGKLFTGVTGLLATGFAVGMSIWDYHENLNRQNLTASYQAAYKGARMNQGRI